MNEISIAERITRLETNQNVLIDRIDKLDNIIENIRLIVVEVQEMRKDLNTVTSKVTEIEKTPAKRFDNIKSNIISAIISCAVGFLFAQIF